MSIAQRSRQQLAVSGEVLSRVVVVQDRYRAGEVGLLQFPGSPDDPDRHALTPPAKVIHISTRPTHPLPQTPTPVYRHQSLYLIWGRTGGGRALRARHPQPAAMPPIFACTTGRPRGCSTSDERLRPHARLAPVGGAARRAPDDRRHGDAGHLRLRDTAPEVGEGQQARGGVPGVPHLWIGCWKDKWRRP